jgi:hypothetical protein
MIGQEPEPPEQDLEPYPVSTPSPKKLYASLHLWLWLLFCNTAKVFFLQFDDLVKLRHINSLYNLKKG